MRQLMIGGLLLFWGLGILLNGLLSHAEPTGSGAYRAGGNFALLVALGMVLAGGRAVLKAVQARRG